MQWPDHRSECRYTPGHDVTSARPEFPGCRQAADRSPLIARCWQAMPTRRVVGGHPRPPAQHRAPVAVPGVCIVDRRTGRLVARGELTIDVHGADGSPRSLQTATAWVESDLSDARGIGVTSDNSAGSSLPLRAGIVPAGTVQLGEVSGQPESGSDGGSCSHSSRGSSVLSPTTRRAWSTTTRCRMHLPRRPNGAVVAATDVRGDPAARRDRDDHGPGTAPVAEPPTRPEEGRAERTRTSQRQRSHPPAAAHRAVDCSRRSRSDAATCGPEWSAGEQLHRRRSGFRFPRASTSASPDRAPRRPDELVSKAATRPDRAPRHPPSARAPDSRSRIGHDGEHRAAAAQAAPARTDPRSMPVSVPGTHQSGVRRGMSSVLPTDPSTEPVLDPSAALGPPRPTRG